MKLISENQLVGTSPGFAVFRNLYEDSNEKRICVPTSHEFEMANERKLGKSYPSRITMFEKHKLPIVKLPS